MHRIFHWVLAAALAVTSGPSFAAGKYEAASSSARKKKKKKIKKARPAEQEQAAEAERAQGEDDESQGARRKRRAKPKVIEVEAADTAAAEKDAAAKEKDDKAAEKEETTAEKVDSDAKTPGEDDAAAKDSSDGRMAVAEPEDDGASLEDSPSKWLQVLNRSVPPRRYAYVVGGVVGAAGLVFAYQAQGEAKRAETIGSALEAQRAVSNARASAALANVMYGLAATAVVLALVLEFLPEPAAEKAALTFHF